MKETMQNELNSRSAQSGGYLKPAFSFSNRLVRFVWGIVYVLLFRFSPRPFFAWRAFLLRCFGASVGRDCHVYPSARIWMPSNLRCDDAVCLADEAIIYNPAPISFGKHAIISQQAYICGATHDYESPDFPLIAFPATVGAYAWICARANVQPGVNIGDGAVLGLASVATHDLEVWTVYAGVPAKEIRKRFVPGLTDGNYRQNDNPVR
jgi:putative colanic acid biosynthesis acetyltransferase WcaF